MHYCLGHRMDTGGALKGLGFRLSYGLCAE